MVNKTTFKQYLLEAEGKVAPAKDIYDLLASIVDGHFTKDGSKLKVTGSFDCGNNQLKSLEGCPQTVGGNFDCWNNHLKSLEGCPQTVGGGFICFSNQLKSLEGCPQTVRYSFDCSSNQLESLEGCPQIVGGGFDCSNNPSLTSLARINFYVHEINGTAGANFSGCPIKSNILGLLKISGLKKVKFDDKQLEEIMNKYLPMGDSTDCIDDLLDAGFSKEYCKW